MRIDTILGRPPRTIAIFRGLMLGDMLCAIPAIRALRHAYPHAHVTLISLPWARDLAARLPRYFDAFAAFPGFPGLPESPADTASFPQFLAAAQQQRYDLVLQLHGSGRWSNPIAMLLGARCVAGFYTPGEYCPTPGTFSPYPIDGPEILRWLRLMAFLGIQPQGVESEFPVTAEDRRALAAVVGRSGWRSQRYICIHAGARLPSRRWSPRRFARVADRLAQRGYRIVLTGTAAEMPLATAVANAMQAEAINLAGQTTLGTLAAVLENCCLLVSNDTGVSHVAAALRVPSVVVVCGSDPNRWAPLDRHRHRTVSYDVACRPCMHAECPIGFPCGEGVGAEEVVDQALRLLATDREPALAKGGE